MSSRIGRKLHLFMMGFWASNFAGVWFLPVGWRIPYLVVVSIYANFVGHLAGFSAERPTQLEQ